MPMSTPRTKRTYPLDLRNVRNVRNVRNAPQAKYDPNTREGLNVWKVRKDWILRD